MGLFSCDLSLRENVNALDWLSYAECTMNIVDDDLLLSYTFWLFSCLHGNIILTAALKDFLWLLPGKKIKEHEYVYPMPFPCNVNLITT